MLRHTRRSQRGFSLAEVMMATALIGVLVYATVTITSTGVQLTKTNMDRQFATQKAISMLEELKALVQNVGGGQILVLDIYDDGPTAYRNRLTTVGNLTDPPDDPVSGNVPAGTGWIYSRQISVRPLLDPTNQPIASTDVRLVRVRVYKNDPAGPRLLAEVASVVRTLAVSYPPTQVFDVYCVAIENIPGWWVNMASLVPFVQAAINDLQDRNPGLTFRQHWITHAAFGRDTQYRPYINTTVPPTNDTPATIPFVYFYPGTFPATYPVEPPGSGTRASAAQSYYPPGFFAATMLDDTGAGGAPNAKNPQNAATNPVPYALADMYNHAMRFYQEAALSSQRLAAMQPIVPPAVTSPGPSYPAEELTLRLLLDDMYANPNKYVNALVINLHGELLPFPATRNYSDAAKKPDQYTNNGVRAVTHPETLSYDNGDSVTLRVYPYVMKPNAVDGTVANEITYSGPAFPGSVTSLSRGAQLNKEWLREPITVVLRGVTWDPVTVPNCISQANWGTVTTAGTTNCVAAISGGVDFTAADQSGSGGTVSPRDRYGVVVPAPITDSVTPGDHRMYYTVAYTAPVPPAIVGDTVIKLYNSPLVSPCVPLPGDCQWDQGDGAGNASATPLGSGGIEHVLDGQWTKRLYGLEYIPSPMENFAQTTAQIPFGRDLRSLGPMTKNTARWVLTIPASVIGNNRVLQVETYIGDYTPNNSALTLGVPTSGTFNPAYTEPTNQSMTFAWHGNNAWTFGNPGGAPPVPPALPLSERFQMLGDPRHCPYADLKMPHASPAAPGNWPATQVDTNLGMGYNRYFDDFEDSFGNETTAWMVGMKQFNPAATATVTIYSSGVNQNNQFAFKVDGGATQVVTLTGTALGQARTLSQIVADLSALTGVTVDQFPPCPAAPPCKQYIRIRSNGTGANSSVQQAGTTAIQKLTATTLGFRSSNTIVYPSWGGWNYSIGGNNYGVKNDGIIGNAGWTTTNGSFEIDVPRMFQTFRSALMRSNSVYTTMTGWPYYYLDIGNAIGYDAANLFDDNVPVSRRPFDGTDNPQYFEQTITPGKQWGDTDTARAGVKYIQEADGTWWSMNWLGELYPDDMYSAPAPQTVDWKRTGNLLAPDPTAGDTPRSIERFLRVRRDPNPLNPSSAAPNALTHLIANDSAAVGFTNPADRTHTPGTTFTESCRRTHEQGTATFYWSGSSPTVVVPAASAQGSLAPGGTEISNNYNLPVDNPIAANRGFNLTGTAPPNDSLAPGQTMYGNTTTLSDQWSNCTTCAPAGPLGLFYNAADGASPPNIRGNEWASELLAIRDGATNQVSFIVQNGLSPTGVAGTDFIARWSFLTLVHSFFDAGQFNGSAAPATTQVPRINITSPNANTNTQNPASLTITWNTTWQRWDGKPYTSNYPTPFTPGTVPAMTFFVSYSSDNGVTWLYAQNNTAATPGVRPDRNPVTGVINMGDPRRVTAATYNWTGIGSLPKPAAYIIRVEAYRDAFPLHYSQHQYEVFVSP